MAHKLHCDGCNAVEDYLIEDKTIPPQGAPMATNEAPLRVKVWRNVKVYGRPYDLCNRCVKAINMVLQLPGDTPLDGLQVPQSPGSRVGLCLSEDRM